MVENSEVLLMSIEAILKSIDSRLELLCNLGMAGLVIIVGACLYHLFWRRRR